MKDTVEIARRLRRDQTDAEMKLWCALRDRQLGGHKFRRQHPIPPYVVDFFCEQTGLIVELDGGQHTAEKDKERTDFLESQEYRIIRFWNNDVLENSEGVLQAILNSLESKPPHPPRLRRSTLSPWERERVKGAHKLRIALAKITAAHGVKGLVKLAVYGDNPDALADYGSLYTSQDGADTLEIVLKTPMGKVWLAEVGGISDRTSAEKLRGTELWVDRDRLPALPEGQYYHADLVGMVVVDEDGKKTGTVVALHNFGAGDLFEIKPLTGNSFYLPFHNDYILAIDIGKKAIVAKCLGALIF